MSTIKKVALCLAVLATMNTAPLMANEAGDIKVRVGAAGVYPTGDSGNIDALGSNAKVEADDAWSLGLSLTYMLTDNIGVGLLGAYPSSTTSKARAAFRAWIRSPKSHSCHRRLPCSTFSITAAPSLPSLAPA